MLCDRYRLRFRHNQSHFGSLGRDQPHPGVLGNLVTHRIERVLVKSQSRPVGPADDAASFLRNHLIDILSDRPKACSQRQCAKESLVQPVFVMVNAKPSYNVSWLLTTRDVLVVEAT